MAGLRPAAGGPLLPPLLLLLLLLGTGAGALEERPVGDKSLPNTEPYSGPVEVVTPGLMSEGAQRLKEVYETGGYEAASAVLSEMDSGDSAALAAGWAGTALRFDGIDDYALVREFQGLPHNEMSVAGWVKVHRHKTYNRIMSHEWVNWGWNLYADGNGVVRFGIGQDNHDFAAGKIIFRDRWHHVVGTYNGTALRVYVDGVPGSRTFVAGQGLDADGFLSIGGAEWDPFWGELDELQVWNRALEAQEVFQLMEQQPTGNEPGLMGYWRMDEGEGPLLRDMTRFGNHAHLGQGRRTPRWVPSNAPVHVPCVALNQSITIKLVGKSAEGQAVSPFITSLPAVGQVLQQVADGSFQPVTSVPVQVQHPASQVLYRAPEAVPVNKYGQEGACVRIGYRVHDGQVASQGEAVQAVDIAVDGALCARRTESLASCWQERTALKYVTAHERPRVSIIVPLYNQPDVLGETVDSVVAQTFKDWEMIIVNDGSTDNSQQLAAALVARYSAQGYRMRLLLKKNGGLADARNFGIRFARAEWIFPLDSDDIIATDFLEKAMALLDGANGRANLAIANLQGFGRDFTWILPEYDPLDLRYTNMFHCSAVFHKSLWDAMPGGYPTTTLFGYEDWAFWVGVEQRVGIRPLYVREFAFLYRIREESMHQTLLKNQEFSLSSVRMLFPTLYPVELLINSHDKYLHSPPEKVVVTVDDKARKFPASAAPRLMRGLIKEGLGFDAQHGRFWEEALQDYRDAADRAEYSDWQPRWRLGLLMQRMGRFAEGNQTMLELFRDFTDLDIAYENLHITSMQRVVRGPVYSDPNMW